jgi:hypothetical protein
VTDYTIEDKLGSICCRNCICRMYTYFSVHGFTSQALVCFSWKWGKISFSTEYITRYTTEKCNRINLLLQIITSINRNSSSKSLHYMCNDCDQEQQCDYTDLNCVTIWVVSSQRTSTSLSQFSFTFNSYHFQKIFMTCIVIRLLQINPTNCMLLMPTEY